MSKSSIAVARPLIKTIIFGVITSLVLVFVAIELGGFTFYNKAGYNAVFTNASDLQDGDPVMVSGVRVGHVTSVALHDNHQSKVTFEVKATVPLDTQVKAAIRYKNLTGDRFLELIPGTRTPESGDHLSAGETIPVARTQPALDLDLLLGGLQPLFEGLDPTQINQLSTELVQVLQGEGGTLQSLLEHVASFTSTLADKDQVIGQVVSNLNSVLGNLDAHSSELSETVTNLQELASGLSSDRSRLGKSFEGVDRLVTSMGGLLTDLRGPLEGMTQELRRVTTQANAGASTINDVLRTLPGGYLRIGRLGARGAGYNLYVCALRLRFAAVGGSPTYSPWIGPADSVERCKPGIAPLETPEEREANEFRNLSQGDD
jgi:phospholipid/cholesterol/gamma-HCH transport system substrate-binding protein